MTQDATPRSAPPATEPGRPILPGDRPVTDAFAPEALASRPRRMLGMAWLVLAWERAAPALAPLVWLGLGFLALALSDILPGLPAWAHVAVLAGFGLAAAAAALRFVTRMRLPRAGEARRRVESDSVLAHRPFAALVDRPATPVDATTPQLWQRHRATARSALGRIRLDGPRRGPLWLAPRAALLCLLLVAASDARDDSLARLARAIDPDLNVAAGGLPAALDLWVTPPAYTGVPPIFASAAQPGAMGAAAQRQAATAPRPGAGTGLLAGDQPIMGLTAAGKLVVPQGSVITAQVTGSRSAPSFVLDGAVEPFAPSEAGAWKVERTLEFGQRLEIRQGSRVLGGWPLQIVADVPPVANFVRNPAPAARGALRIDAEATDDYGVEALQLKLERLLQSMPSAGNRGDAGRQEPPFEVPLALGAGRQKRVEATSYQDLTAHPWAGLEVVATLEAKDASGQVGRSDSIVVKLPERNFSHPIARAIVAERKRLTTEPEERADIALNLRGIGARPKLYADDKVVYLGLRMAFRRLHGRNGAEEIGPVQGLLWSLALRIEDGGLSLAERDLRELQQRLMEALERGAPDHEIEKLISELQAALDRFLEQLAKQAESMPLAKPGERPDVRWMRPDDFKRMLDQMRELSRSGARDKAKEMLSRLRDMLENLRAGPRMAERDEKARQGSQMLDAMQDLIDRQNELLNRTYREMQRRAPGDQMGQDRQRGRRQGRQGQEGGQQPPSAADQEQLRRRLGELMRRLGELGGEMPGELGRAERSMRQSEGALGEGEPGQSIGPQTDAIDQLTQGLQSMADQLGQQLGQGQGEQMSDRPDGRRGRNETDPLGRNETDQGRGLNESNVGIPTEMELRRARAILDELRRRAGERSRPTIERDYIDRLLNRF